MLAPSLELGLHLPQTFCISTGPWKGQLLGHSGLVFVVAVSFFIAREFKREVVAVCQSKGIKMQTMTVLCLYGCMICI